MRTPARLVLVTVAAALAVGCSSTPADPGLETFMGAWSGTLTHDGEEEAFALELEPAEEGKVLLRLTAPAMGLSRQEAGVVEPRIEGRRITLGPFVLTHDGETDSLNGTMPAGMVPVYEIPLTLRRVDAVEPLNLPEPGVPSAEPAWTFEAGAPSWPGPTHAEGLVYAGDDAGRLHALDARTGEERWSFAAEGPIRTRPTVEDGALFFQADDGVLYRLDPSTGRQAWRVQIMEDPVERVPLTDPGARYDPFGSDVTVADGRLFLGTYDGRVLAVDPADGTILWEFEAEGSVLAAPAVAHGRVVFGAFGGKVHALDAATGEPAWETDTKGAVLSTPAVAGDLFIVGNRAYDLLALDGATGEVAWKEYVWFSWIESSATVVDGVAYIGSSDAAAVYAIAQDTGMRSWESPVYGWAWGQPAVTGERVFIGTAGLRGYAGDTRRGGVLALDRASGRAVWRYALEPPDEGAWGFPGSPAVGDGHVFVTGIDGRVLAFLQ